MALKIDYTIRKKTDIRKGSEEGLLGDGFFVYFSLGCYQKTYLEQKEGRRLTNSTECICTYTFNNLVFCRCGFKSCYHTRSDWKSL